MKYISRITQQIHPSKLKVIYTNHEDIRIATIVYKTIIGLYAAFLIVLSMAGVSGDVPLIFIILIGAALLAIPTFFLFNGKIRISSIVLCILVMITMAASTVFGQGIHDIAILAYPVAIFFANLVLNRQDFFGLSILILALFITIGFGETFGWFIPSPFKDSPIFDLIIGSIILITAIMIADLLAENIRENFQLAQKEISLRKKAQDELRHLNIHDKLTGIYNRSFFDEMIMLIERKNEYPASIMFADIDNLKQVNDQYGHAAGDELLRRTANMLAASFRDGDIFARIGGDEFAVLLPQTDQITSKVILERLRAHLTEFNAAHPNTPIWISLGTATAENGNLKKALIDADQRMYEDKAARKSG